MLAQNELERELYEGRLKAKRDMQTLETHRRTAEEQRRTAEEQRRTAEEQRRTAEVERAQWQERYEAARWDVKRELQERIRLCQRMLQRPVSSADELLVQGVEELQSQAERLQREVTGGS